jgi:hypothetical protein
VARRRRAREEVAVRARVLMLAVLMVGACARQFTTVGKTGYTPKWHVGDWWVASGWTGYEWRLLRYDLLGIEGVGGRECFVLQEKKADTTATPEGERTLFYVRNDNWRVVRVASYSKSGGPYLADYPEGTFGFAPGQPCLPWFPLDTSAAYNSTFRRYEITRSVRGVLRQHSGLADSVLMRRYVAKPAPPSASDSRFATGTMFSVLVEGGVPGQTRMPDLYSLQLWSSDCPWRLYEEEGAYAPDGMRDYDRRTWLVAWGHSSK